MFKQIAHYLSLILPFKIKYGNSFTTEPTLRLRKMPTQEPVSLLYFNCKKDLGTFEVLRVIVENKNIKYEVLHLETKHKFIMPKKWFDFLFEEVLLDYATLIKLEHMHDE